MTFNIEGPERAPIVSSSFCGAAVIKIWKRARRRAMNRASARRASRTSGYSLMEILIVLAIIGLLVALVGPQLTNLFGGAQTKTARMQIRTLKQAVETMNLDIGRYPTQEEGLNLLVQAPTDGTTNWNGPYLSDGLPADPWKKPYLYTAPVDGQPPKITSFGKDGAPNGAGADEDIVG